MADCRNGRCPTGTWTLDYTISDGLNLVANSGAAGSTGLYGLTDVLGDLTAQAGESFVPLEQAPADTTFKGVAFAPSPVPEPSTWAMMLLGFVDLGFAARRQRQAKAASPVHRLG